VEWTPRTTIRSGRALPLPALVRLCTSPRLLDVIEPLWVRPGLLYAISEQEARRLRVAWPPGRSVLDRLERDAVTAWVALDDATIGEGCMRVIPASQPGTRTSASAGGDAGPDQRSPTSCRRRWSTRRKAVES